MEIKLFEVRDRMTFIPVIAIKLTYRDAAERYLLRRAGYADEQIRPKSAERPYVLFGRVDGEGFNYDPFRWHGRTFPIAHRYVEENWDALSTGEVVDVEFILREKPAPKQSESLGSDLT